MRKRSLDAKEIGVLAAKLANAKNKFEAARLKAEIMCGWYGREIAICSRFRNRIIVHFASGAELSFPSTRRLARAKAAAVCTVNVSALGLHWPDVDEDLSFAGLLRGKIGRKR